MNYIIREQYKPHNIVKSNRKCRTNLLFMMLTCFNVGGSFVVSTSLPNFPGELYQTGLYFYVKRRSVGAYGISGVQDRPMRRFSQWHLSHRITKRDMVTLTILRERAKFQIAPHSASY